MSQCTFSAECSFLLFIVYFGISVLEIKMCEIDSPHLPFSSSFLPFTSSSSPSHPFSQTTTMGSRECCELAQRGLATGAFLCILSFEIVLSENNFPSLQGETVAGSFKCLTIGVYTPCISVLSLWLKERRLHESQVSFGVKEWNERMEFVHGVDCLHQQAPLFHSVPFRIMCNRQNNMREIKL